MSFQPLDVTMDLDGRRCVYRYREGWADALVAAAAGAGTVAVVDGGLRRALGPDGAAALDAALHRAGCGAVLPVAGGEAVKTLTVLERLYEGLATLGIARDAVIVGVGGGATLDLAGLAAATWRRGIDWIAVPTTLLAMVDAAIGGKTAVNAAGLKNPVGAVHPPRCIVADTALLASLSRRHWRSGMAELVKAALIADADLFAELEVASADLARHLASGEAESPVASVLTLPWHDWIPRAVRVKTDLVDRDFREAGPRQALNLGHTLGHVLEADAPPGGRRPDHGEAVAVGTVVAFRLAVARGLCRADELQRIRALLQACGLPVTWPAPSLEAVATLIRGDKKSRGGTVRWVLPRGIGAVVLGQAVTAEEARTALVAADTGS